MDLNLYELPETQRPMEELKLYTQENGSGVGFEDDDGQFKALVINDGLPYKKRISRKCLEQISNIKDVEQCI
jgi:hypothetical protein